MEKREYVMEKREYVMEKREYVMEKLYNACLYWVSSRIITINTI